MPHPKPFSHSETMINLAFTAGVASASRWSHGNERSIASVLTWRAKHLTVFEREIIGHPEFLAIREAWETGFDSEVDDAVSESSATATREVASVDSNHEQMDDRVIDEFQTRVIDICSGIRACMTLLERAEGANDEAGEKVFRPVTSTESKNLQRLASAAASMLADQVKLLRSTGP